MQTILITGASRGIGAATALLAAEMGYAVAVNYNRNSAAAERIASQINAGGGKAITIQADIAQEKDILHLFSEIDKHLGRLNCLVNNAGILEQQMRVAEMNMERLNRIFSANVIGHFICTREAVRRMSTRNGGHGGTIINVSSVAARTGSPGEYVDYAASKGALDTFTIGLSKEVAGEGIRVNGIRPGFIYTDIHADGGEPGRVDRIKETIPLKRGGQPQEVAKAIMWLASEESSFCTGTFIDVSGGR